MIGESLADTVGGCSALQDHLLDDVVVLQRPFVVLHLGKTVIRKKERNKKRPVP